MRRSLRWAERCKAAATRDDQALFAIVQGGLDAELRAESAEQLVALDFVGYAIGGLSVGESPPEMYAALDVTTPLLPRDRPRYLMGVGRPIDLLEGDQPRRRPVRLRDADAERPQRAGVHRCGPVRLRNQQHAHDREPLDRGVPMPGVPPQPRLSAASVSGGRDAGADAGLDAQPDVLPAADGRGAAGDRGGSVGGVRRRSGGEGGEIDKETRRQ